MEDKLKQFVQTHRDEFDNEQLPEGHFERFEAKLPAQRHTLRPRIITLAAFAAAACVAFLLIYKLPFGLDGEHKAPYVCELRQEVDEVKLFYHMQMNDIVTQMEDIYAQAQVPGTADLLKETKKMQLDSQKFEKEVLPSLPCSSDAVFTINQYYGNQLESMRHMLEYMTQLSGHQTHY